MKKEIKLPHETSIYIEELFYKYNASSSLIDFLLRSENPNKEIIDNYRKENYELYMSLEIAKRQTDLKYRSKELVNKSVSYVFDFDKESLIYTYEA